MGADRARLYDAIFAHLGLGGAERALAVGLMRLFEAGNRRRRAGRTAGRRHHLRSGSSDQWRDELDPEHLAYIEAELGHVIAKFGYARAAPPGRADRGVRAEPVAD